MSTYQISLEAPCPICRRNKARVLWLWGALVLPACHPLPGGHLCQAPVPDLTHQESMALDLEVKGERVEKSVLDLAGAVLCI